MIDGFGIYLLIIYLCVLNNFNGFVRVCAMVLRTTMHGCLHIVLQRKAISNVQNV